MSAKEWFVIDTRTDRIIDSMTTTNRRPSLGGFIEAEHLRATRTPTRAQLEAYEYWRKRP